MTLREILTGTSGWLRSHRYEEAGRCEPVLTDDGLLACGFDMNDDFSDAHSANAKSDPVVVNTVSTLDPRDPAEKLHEGINRLVDQLQHINEHLNCQLQQHEELMDRVRELPKSLESLPAAVENQRQLTTRLLEQLRSTSLKDQQFIDAVGRIPQEAARQTDALSSINHQLAAAADTDVQLVESFVKFKGTLERLNHNTVSNTEGILQMSRTFAASDRYLKYVIAKMNRRYAWTLALALSVCTGVVSVLAALLFFLAS